MKTQYATALSQHNVTHVPSVPNTISNILALGALEERGCVAHLQDVVVKLFPNTYAMKALDLNAGRGIAAVTLAELGFQVAAYDVHRSSISVIQKMAMQQELNISFRADGVAHLDDLQEKFDVIHDRACFTHTAMPKERAQFLKAVKGALALNGKFILTTAVLNGAFDANESFESVMLDPDYVLWRQTPEADASGVKAMDGKFWTAQKRLAPADVVRRELMDAGFEIVTEELEIVTGHSAAILKVVLKVA